MEFHLVQEYKKLGFNQGLMSLWSGRLLLNFSINIFSLFLPIVLFQEFGDINIVVLYFFASVLGYFLFGPVGAKIINYIGLKKSLLLAVLFRLPYFYAWYRFDDNPWLYAGLAALSMVFIRAFFWMPFNVSSSTFSDKSQRGKQFGVIFAMASLLSIVAPVVGGFVLERWDFSVLVLLSCMASLLSLVSFGLLPETKEEYSWSYLETFKYLFHPFNRRMVIGYMSDGAVSVINLVFWPLFIFTILDEKYQSVGLLTGGVLLVGLILRLVIGGMLDKYSKIKLVKIGAILNSTAWIVKIVVVSAFHVFLASIYHTLALIVLRSSMDTFVYEKAADRGHYIDEYTLIRDLAIQLGKLSTLILVVIFLLVFPLQVSFVIAAIAALFINLLR